MTYEEHYSHTKSIVVANEDKYTVADVVDLEVDENGPPQHVWSKISPSTEETRSQSLAEGSELLTDL